MAFLLLEDGTMFPGELFGAKENATGEVVFNTGMTGYQEVLTDPSYFGQIIVMTYPLIGNYGVNPNDMESDSIFAKGFVVSSLCDRPSNWLSGGIIDNFLKARGITGIKNVDTRALTKKIRNAGVMRGKIVSSFLETDKEEILSYRVVKPVFTATCKEHYVLPAIGEAKYRIAVLDCGAKQNIVRSLQSVGCEVAVYPALTPAGEILANGCDGVLFTNGPGDPKDNESIFPTVRKLVESKPSFGICLGHQLMALAFGGNTEKLKYGHRGGNHPVKDLRQDRVYITSQNHGYAVIADSVKDFARVTHENWNDHTVEGLAYKNYPAFSVQYHPEAAPGPRDSFSLFTEFIQLIDNNK